VRGGRGILRAGSGQPPQKRGALPGAIRCEKACEDLPQTQVQGPTNKAFYEEVKIPEGKALTSTMVMKKVLEANVLIAAPVAKSHSATGVSMALKGMMGLIYDRKDFT